MEKPIPWTAARLDAGRFDLAWALGSAFALVVVEALYSVPALTWELSGGGSRSAVGVGLAAAAAALALVWAGRARAMAGLAAAQRRLSALSLRSWLAAVILGGLALRLAWVLLVPAPQSSDGLAYWDLGVRLAHGESYRSAAGYGEWPPGLPLLLAPFLFAFGARPWVFVLVNLLLWCATVPVVHALGLRLGVGEGAARLATLLLALWPNLIATCGLVSKELLLALLLPLGFLLYLRADAPAPAATEGVASRLAAGVALGYAGLTQPALLPLAGIFALHELLRRAPWRRAAVRLALLLLGMGIALAPWAVRNARIYRRPVLVSTNGGSVFYRANNPRATGGWTERGERSLAGLDELTASRLGYLWGWEWISAHPGDFLALAVRKQVLLLGDDADGIYETLKRGLGVDGAVYAGLKLLADGYWWLLCALLLAGILVCAPRAAGAGDLRLCLLALLSVYAIDSVFESGSRHHVPLAGLLALLVASGAGAVGAEEGGSGLTGPAGAGWRRAAAPPRS